MNPGPNSSGNFAIDVSRAVIPPKAPNEMWTQTRTLKRAVLCPITHLPHHPSPCTAHGTASGFSAACVYTEHPYWKLEMMATPRLSDIPSCAASVLAQASVPYRTLCTLLCAFPGAPFRKPSCQLSVYIPSLGSLYIPSSLTTTTA